jgi:hypothetical protein
MGEDKLMCLKLRSAWPSGEVLDLSWEQSEHLRECKDCMSVLLDRQLDSKPLVKVPEDFAARVTAMAAKQKPMVWRPKFRGLTTSLVLSSVVLLAGAAAVSAWPLHFSISWLGLALEATVVLEAAGLVLWTFKETDV